MAKITKRPLFDLSQIHEFRDVFPELTPDQLEVAMLLSLGLSHKEIAVIRGVALKTIDTILATIRDKFDFFSLNNLLLMFQVRLVFFALSECKRHNSTRALSGIDKTDEGSHHA